MIRRPQFTLRALLVAMLVVGAFFGGYAWKRRLVQQQISDMDEEKRFLEFSVLLLTPDTKFTPEHHFFMDEESWSLVQHAAEKARLDTEVWITRRLAKAASKELRRRSPPED